MQKNAEKSDRWLNLKRYQGTTQLAFSGGKLPPPFRGLNQYHVLWAWLFIHSRIFNESNEAQSTGKLWTYKRIDFEYKYVGHSRSKLKFGHWQIYKISASQKLGISYLYRIRLVNRFYCVICSGNTQLVSPLIQQIVIFPGRLEFCTQFIAGYRGLIELCRVD